MKKQLLVLAAGLALVGTTASAQQRADARQKSGGPARPGRYTVPVYYTKLPNGLRVVVSENHTAPIVTVEVMYKIGFRIEPKGRTGFAHLFEHMMFQGSEQVGKFEHVQLVNANGGALNGSTRFDYTNYFEAMPANALEIALWLEADRMASLKVTDENLKNQQNVVSEEVRVNVLNQPYAGFDWINLPQRANTNWYNAHNFYGDLAELEAATVGDVKKFFDTYYVPNNAVLVVVGDTTPDEVVKLATKHFGRIPSRPVPPLPDVSEPPQKEEKKFSEEDKLARAPAIALGYHLPERMSKDFFALTLLDPLLVSDESAKFYQKLVKEKQLASNLYGAFNLLGNNWDMSGPMLYTVRVDYRNDATGDQVVAAIDEVLDRIQKEGISEDELKQARVSLRSSFLEDLEANVAPGFGTANLLAAFALFDDNPGRINTILDELDRITAAEIQAAAKKWFVKTNRTIIDRRPVAKPTGASLVVPDFSRAEPVVPGFSRARQ